MRGENCDDQPINLAGAGSSPLARGKHYLEKWRERFYLGSSPREQGKHFSIWGFMHQIGQILESPKSCAYVKIYSLPDAYTTNSRDQAQNTGSPHCSKSAPRHRLNASGDWPPGQSPPRSSVVAAQMR